MDPNNQRPQGSPSVTQQNNPYGFILETPKKKKFGIPKPGNSTGSRLLFAAGGLFVLIIAVSVFSTVLSGSNKENTLQLKQLVAEQQEIARIADIGIKSATDPSVVAYAQTAKLTVQSQQVQLVAYLTKKKVKVTPVILNTYKNTKTDSALTAALAANRFDTVFNDTIENALTTYAGNLKTDYETTKGKTGKTILSTSYTNTTLMLK